MWVAWGRPEWDISNIITGTSSSLAFSRNNRSFSTPQGNGCTVALAGRRLGSLCQSFMCPNCQLPFALPPNPPPFFSLPAALLYAHTCPALRNFHLCTHLHLQVSQFLRYMMCFLSLSIYRFSVAQSLLCLTLFFPPILFSGILFLKKLDPLIRWVGIKIWVGSSSGTYPN